MVEAVLLDIDGTLVDNTLLHVLAWQRAFQRLGRQIDANTILHKIGMGGDQLAPSVLGPEAREEAARAQRFHGEEYTAKGLIDHCEPVRGAVELVRALKGRGVRVALASSARRQEVERYLTLLGIQRAVDAIVTAEEVSATKPAPDVFATALAKLGRPSRARDRRHRLRRGGGGQARPAVRLRPFRRHRARGPLAGRAAAIYDHAAAVAAHLDDVLNLPARQ